MRRTISVDPQGWILDLALDDYYRAILPLGDTKKPDSEIAALMEALPGHEPTDLYYTHQPSRRTLCQRTIPNEGLRQVVEQALQELPEIHRIVIETLYGGDLSLRQVERITGIPKTTVARKRDEVPKLLGEILKRLMPSLADKYYLD
tara:strand:+ start:77 stop:517 length:441 start_codon:yes stop_codon:yes gene_type:complete